MITGYFNIFVRIYMAGCDYSTAK